MWPFSLCGSDEEGADAGTVAERQPLLPQREQHDTALQQRLRKKLQTFQMLQAVKRGSLPSNRQITAHIRALLDGPSLNATSPEAFDALSPSGQELLHVVRQWIEQLATLLDKKNADDQIEDFVWYLAQSSVAVKVQGNRGPRPPVKPLKNLAVQQSLTTVGSLLLENSNIRLLLADIASVGRQVFSDTALALSDASRSAAQHIEPAATPQIESGKVEPESKQDELGNTPIQDTVTDFVGEVAEGAAQVAVAAQESVSRKLVDNENNTRTLLLSRLRRAVEQLRQRPDYTTSISVLSEFLGRCLDAYTSSMEAAVGTNDNTSIQVETNDETYAAVRSFWALLTSFGDADAWAELTKRFRHLHDRTTADGRQLDSILRDIGDAVQDMLTDPAFFDHADEYLAALRTRVQAIDGSLEPGISSLQEDLNAVLAQIPITFRAALQDEDLTALLATSSAITDLVGPGSDYAGATMLADTASVFLPQLIQAVQFVPIPRLEVATPDLDLLLENLILQPGQTVNDSSFLPFRLHVQIRNDVDVRKARFGTAAGLTTTATVALDGLSVAAEDVGFVLRLHAGPLLRLTDTGLVSFRLDERGVDVHLDVAVVRDMADTMLALRDVQVHIHRVALHVKRTHSCASWLAWLVSPILRPWLRRRLERQLADTIADHLCTLNRELVFARERLRATRIAQPGDVSTFLRAITARFEPSADAEYDLDRSVRVGVRPDPRGPFAGVYAPGSLARVWDEEAAQASERLHEYKRDGWRSDVFDLTVR